jgi:hypothetical protein
MKVALVYPPYSSVIAPHLALPALTAFLRREGREVVQADANLWLHRWLLTPRALEQRLGELREESRRLAAGPGDRSRLLNLAAWIGIIPQLSARIEESRAALGRRETWRMDPRSGRGGHARHAGLLRIAETLLLHDFPLDRWTTLSAAELVRVVRQGSHPLLARFDREVFTPWLRRTKPDLVGFTVPFRQQLLPALTLAAAVRREAPGAKVVFGGHLMTQQLGDPQRLAALFDLLDFAVVHDGEESLSLLCRQLEQGGDPARAGNLLWRDPGGMVRTSPTAGPLSPADLPAPDFQGLEVEGYLSGAVIYPLETSRGCYWNRCTYCSYHRGEDGAWRPFPLERVAANLEGLVARHGAAAVMVVDEAVPPNRARRLAGIIQDQGLDLAWYFMGRLEEGFTADLCRQLADSGLYGIFFGLESGCEEVLGRMGKGIDLQAATGVLDNLAAAGLAAHLSLIGGFPGETAEQAEQTRDLAVELIRGVPGFTANAHTFHLNRNSEVFDNPAQYGIAGGRGEDGQTLAIHFEAEPLPGAGGPGPGELAALINAGLRPHTHPQILTEEQGVNYFLNHGRQEFLRLWARGMNPPRAISGDADLFRATGEVVPGRAESEGPAGGVTLCHLVRGVLVGAPASAGRVLALFTEGPEGDTALNSDGVWERLGRPAALPAPALRGILAKLCEFGALEKVDD